MDIVISGIPWRIIRVAPNDRRLYRSDNTLSLAVTDMATREICINANVQGAMFDKVLCHELAHAFAMSNSVYMDEDTEEIVCDYLATYGRDIFKVADDVLDRFRRCKYGNCR